AGRSPPRSAASRGGRPSRPSRPLRWAGAESASARIACIWQRIEYRPLRLPLAAPAMGGSGRSAAWLAHLTGGQGVGGSNPVAPTEPGRLNPPGLFRFLGAAHVLSRAPSTVVGCGRLLHDDLRLAAIGRAAFRPGGAGVRNGEAPGRGSPAP